MNVNNSQWHLTLAACLILLSSPRTGRVRRITDAGVLLLFALSGPFSVICAPLALWVLWRDRRRGAAGTANAGPIIVIAAAALQAAYLLAGSRAVGGEGQFGLPAVAEIIRIVGAHGVFNSVMGLSFMSEHHTALPAGSYFAAVLVFPALAFAAFRLRNLPLAVLLGLAGASVSAMLFFPLNDPRVWLNPAFGCRYFYFATLSVIYALLVMTERGRWWRLAGAPCLAIVLFSGVRGDFHTTELPDTHWPDQIAVFRTLPPGTSFSIPIHPQPLWNMTLVKKAGAAELSRLKRFKMTDCGLFASITVSAVSAPYDAILFQGFAVDVVAKKAAGGVFLLIDGQVYPAATGIRLPAAALLAAGRSPSEEGYSRLVSRAELGPGSHRVQVFALDHARTALLQPGPEADFSIPGRVIPADQGAP